MKTLDQRAEELYNAFSGRFAKRLGGVPKWAYVLHNDRQSWKSLVNVVLVSVLSESTEDIAMMKGSLEAFQEAEGL